MEKEFTPEWISISQYLGVRDRYYWLDSLLARLNQNPEPANIATVLTEWQRGYQGEGYPCLRRQTNYHQEEKP